MKAQKGQFLRSDKMTRKEKDLKFIKNFSKITIKKVCENINVAKQNIFNEKASEKTIERVKEEIEKEIAKLYIERNSKNV